MYAQATPYVAQLLGGYSWLAAYGTYSAVAALSGLAVLRIPLETTGQHAAAIADVAELEARMAAAVEGETCGCARKDRNYVPHP